MLCKYLFYATTFYIKKYDNLWNVGDIYYGWGSGSVGIIIATTIMSIMDLIGIFFFHELIWSKWIGFAYLPITLGVISTIYFGYKRRCDRVYDEVRNLEPKIKRKYKIINIIHIILVLGIYFNTKALLEWYVK